MARGRARDLHVSTFRLWCNCGRGRIKVNRPKRQEKEAMTGAPRGADSANCGAGPESRWKPCGIPAGSRSAGSILLLPQSSVDPQHSPERQSGHLSLPCFSKEKGPLSTKGILRGISGRYPGEFFHGNSSVRQLSNYSLNLSDTRSPASTAHGRRKKTPSSNVSLCSTTSLRGVKLGRRWLRTVANRRNLSQRVAWTDPIN